MEDLPSIERLSEDRRVLIVEQDEKLFCLEQEVEELKTRLMVQDRDVQALS